MADLQAAASTASRIRRSGVLRRALGLSLATLGVAALAGCSSAAPETLEAPETPKSSPAPVETTPAPAAEEPVEFPMPEAAGDPGQSLEEACTLLYAGSAIHQEGASALNLKDKEELARELPRIVSESQAEFVKVGNPQATAIATEYSKQVALMSQAMLGGEYAVTEIAAAGGGGPGRRQRRRCALPEPVALPSGRKYGRWARGGR